MTGSHVRDHVWTLIKVNDLAVDWIFMQTWETFDARIFHCVHVLVLHAGLDKHTHRCLYPLHLEIYVCIYAKYSNICIVVYHEKE